MRIKRKIGELGMSLGGSLLLKRKGKSVILCGTAGAGFPVALGAPTPAQECGVAAPYSASGILLARQAEPSKKGEEKEKGYLTGWQKIQLTWLKDKTTRNIHDRTP